MKKCMFSGEDCLQDQCMAWRVLPSFEDKECVLVVGGIASVLLANQAMRSGIVPMPVFDDGDE